jgi:hypothetical protein
MQFVSVGIRSPRSIAIPWWDKPSARIMVAVGTLMERHAVKNKSGTSI